MNFISGWFFLFLLVVLLGYFLLPHKVRWLWLLVSSYFFYAVGSYWLVFLIFSVTLVCYACAIGIKKFERHKKAFLVLAFVVSLGSLFVFKYLDFAIGTVSFFAKLMGNSRGFDALNIILPIGISFYTFQSLSYVVDVYRGKNEPEKHFGYFALFVSFFPQLVAGPIERFDNLMPQLKQEHRFDPDDFFLGARYMLLGFMKKVIIADFLAIIVNEVYGDIPGHDGGMILVATVCFAFQIYGDFSGYSDIAKGAAKMMGIDLMENFNSPYLATSIRDFWRRWHISLSRWFTDYVYIPLGGNKNGKSRQCLNIFIVFLLSGLWHGANWKFVVWGAIHGLLLVIETLLPHRCKECHPVLVWFKRIGVFLLVDFAWIFFRAGSIGEAGLAIGKLFTSWNLVTGIGAYFTLEVALRLLMCAGLLALGHCLPTINFKEDWNRGALAVMVSCFAIVLIGLCWASNDYSGGGSAFIYFQF